MAFLFQVKRKIRSSKKVSEIVDKGNGYKMWFFFALWLLVLQHSITINFISSRFTVIVLQRKHQFVLFCVVLFALSYTLVFDRRYSTAFNIVVHSIFVVRCF